MIQIENKGKNKSENQLVLDQDCILILLFLKDMTDKNYLSQLTFPTEWIWIAHVSPEVSIKATFSEGMCLNGHTCK